MSVWCERLQPFVERRLIAVQKHPTEDLWIYNYTKKAQYEGAWTEETLAARGLILDAAGQVVARPFRKFFNLDELGPDFVPPIGPFAVMEKLDGSLGVDYAAHDGSYAVATRGSFTGVQAVKGTELLHERYAHVLPRLEPELTYLVEIIYPGNRIVVDYGDREELVLIGCLETATGAERELPNVGFPVVPIYDGITELAKLRELAADNREGFVVRFADGSRVKVKFAEYVRLHRLLTGVTARAIWDLLRAGQSTAELVYLVPEEFAGWVRQTETDLRAAYERIERACREAFRDLGDRKQNALYYQSCRDCPHPSILFAMLDGKPYQEIIWKLIRPAVERPFKEDEG